MMDRPLLIRDILWRAERLYGDKTVVARADGGLRVVTYAELGDRVRRLAAVLGALGVQPGDRVGVVGWNTHRALEASLAVPIAGAVFHGVNVRMSVDQVRHTCRHARDRVLLADADHIDLVAELLPDLPEVRSVVVMDAAPPLVTTADGRPVLAYEELLAASEPMTDLPAFDEREACALYYTSGTTGDPKGVLFSHRGTVLMTLAMCLHGNIGIREADVFLAIAPIFHLNAWGAPYAAALQGATLVLPGRHPTAGDCVELLERQRVTVAAGAASVGILLRDHLEAAERAYDLGALETLWLGGQAPPVDLMRWWEREHGVTVVQGWGMTETTSMVAFTNLRAADARLSPDERYAIRRKQGVPLPLCRVRIVADDGAELPWDGTSAGELHVRSPWVASAYFDDAPSSHRDGWLCTGDIATIDPQGRLRLVDRARDVVKSGGEWISSVELESRLVEHPAVRDAAVVAVPHEKWLERPVAFVTVDGEVGEDDLRAHVRATHPGYWVPDRFVVVDALPRTSVGKTDKARLRAELAAGGAPA